MSGADIDEEAPLDPAAERLRRKLARLVLVSGGIMFAGLIAVFAAIVYKLGMLGAVPGARSGGRPGPVQAQIAVPAGATLLSTDIDGSHALLAVAAADGSTELIHVDLATGAVLGRYSLRPE
jgi:hypothetical protein